MIGHVYYYMKLLFGFCGYSSQSAYHETCLCIQSVGLAEQQRRNCVQFHFHSFCTPGMQRCTQQTLGGKLILQFRLNEF